MVWTLSRGLMRPATTSRSMSECAPESQSQFASRVTKSQTDSAQPLSEIALLTLDVIEKSGGGLVQNYSVKQLPSVGQGTSTHVVAHAANNSTAALLASRALVSSANCKIRSANVSE